jgi:2,3-di-O-geranylgeranylglyceryl phosphate reductase (EC 1.3.99.-)
MKDRYDVLVVGGGPGGAVAAETAAARGLSVCLVEKRPAIGTPVRCAEGIGREALAEFIAPDPAWIAAEIKEASVVAPDGTELVLNAKLAGNKVGCVLERKIFDRELVRRAAEAGADIAVKTTATAPVMEDGAARGAHLTGDVPQVGADVVIAADGVESRFARMCGIDTTVPASEMMTCAQYLMTGIDIAPGRTVFTVGNDIAPQGYLWIFPKGDRTANVGIGISGKKSGSRPPAKGLPRPVCPFAFPLRQVHRVHCRRCPGLPPPSGHNGRRAYDRWGCGKGRGPVYRGRDLQCDVYRQACRGGLHPTASQRRYLRQSAGRI